MTSWFIFSLIKGRGVGGVEAAVRISGLELGGLLGSLSSGAISDRLIKANNDPNVGNVGLRVKVCQPLPPLPHSPAAVAVAVNVCSQPLTSSSTSNTDKQAYVWLKRCRTFSLQQSHCHMSCRLVLLVAGEAHHFILISSGKSWAFTKLVALLRAFVTLLRKYLVAHIVRC